MATSYSSLLRIELPGNGDQSGIWGATTNNNLGTLIDQAIAGTASITMLDADYTLSAYNGVTDEARQMVLNISGTLTANRNIICPSTSKLYVIKNNTTGGFSVVLKTASGTGVTVTNGNTTIAYCDNTNVVDAVTALPAGTTVGGVPIVTTTGTQTLSNKTLTSPKFADGGFIADANGNELVVLDTVGSAVNELTVANAATGTSPSISATGSDSNIDLLLVPKGTGVTKSGGVEVVTLTGTQTLSNKTLTSPTITTPTISSPASVSATTGNAAIIEATGPDTNININLTPKGSGSVLFGGVAPALTPTGVVVPFAGTSAPAGWLLSFGQTVSRTTYAALFAVIGTTYGAGDGSTTFGLPDLRGRVVAGEDDMGGTSANRLTGLSGGVNGDILGGTGGLETHTLTVAQIPLHGHPAYISTSGTDPNTTGGLALNAETVSTYSAYTGTLSSTPGQQIGGTGGGDSHNNVQPTIILNYIIKT